MDFERSRSLLLTRQDQESLKFLGNLCSFWGQAYFLVKDYDRCGNWLSHAEETYRGLGFKPDLAFSLAYQGLVWITIGRMGSTSAYDRAYSTFEEAEVLIQKSGIFGMLWQILFYKGIVSL